MTVPSLLDAARRRRSPATMPGYQPAAHRATKATVTPPTHRPWTRSSPLCATPATTVTGGGCAR
jgi:hypothetical protein